MDKGAHFHKCDFQVHTPRDIQWTGNRFGVDSLELALKLTEEQKAEFDESRIQFAKEYLQKARDKGLNAVAITDHHDVTFSKIIRRVAEIENKTFAGNGEFNKIITVFPGIELTLVTPNCQSIIVFDSDFPDNQLDSVLLMFGILPSNEYENKTAPTERITTEHINDLRHLHKKLEETSYCKGRYIVLPNLGHGGNSTLLRQGAHDHYIKMPCVGGYVDKAMPTDTGWLNKTNGGDVNYGNKSVGVISTSDNRYEDGREFGNYYTWIKWATPSAEALRQACLAKQSRISQEQPLLPQITITKIDVTNSKFLGSFAIEFNKQYNALIGGRGTGKSTILEYLRWGLCDQTIFSSDVESLTDIESRRKKLIDKTLADFDGEVRITFTLNGIPHIVKRNSITKETSLKIDSADFQIVSEEEVRKILPIQAYSQKQLSSVGVSTEELKRFIQTPISTELANFDFQLAEIVKRSRTEYLNLSRKSSLEIENSQFNLEITSLNNQAQSLRSLLTGMSDGDQALIAKKTIYDNEVNIVSNIQRELNSVAQKINELDQFLVNYPQPIPGDSPIENSEILNQLDEARASKFTEIKALVTQLKETLSPDNSAQLRNIISQWSTINEAFNSQYEVAKSRSTSHQQHLTEIQRIEERLQQLRESINERVTTLREIGNPELAFDALRVEYWALHRNKASVLKNQADKFSVLSKGLIKVDVEKQIDSNKIKSELVRVLQGTRINSEKIQVIVDDITNSDDPLLSWEAILNELRALAEFIITDQSSAQTIPSSPKLTELGLNDNNLRKVTEFFTKENWLDMALMKIEYTPEFKYTTNSEMEDVIAFSEASAGQQATALLTVLLNQPGTPLLIDQPEDDIDNRAIDDIIKNIWEAKKHRQLIFTSHNANLVVNGDAELVVCCDYRDAGSQTRGILKAEGAIDSKAVRDEITAVMEGGEKAFKLRMEKYGF